MNEYPDRIPTDVAYDMLQAINCAVEGEIKEGRLLPSYTNIALLYGYLWDFAAGRDHRADWAEQSTQWQESVYKPIYQNWSIFASTPDFARSFMVRNGGTAVAVSGIEVFVSIDMQLFQWDKIYINPLYGQCRPFVDFPKLLSLYAAATSF
jgi:hypothetical protein